MDFSYLGLGKVKCWQEMSTERTILKSHLAQPSKTQHPL